MSSASPPRRQLLQTAAISTAGLALARHERTPFAISIAMLQSGAIG